MENTCAPLQGDMVKQFKDNNVNKEDPEFKKAISELKLRKKALEEQVGDRVSRAEESHELLFRLPNGCRRRRASTD